MNQYKQGWITRHERYKEINLEKKKNRIFEYDENGPIIDVNSSQAKVWPEIANTHCWITKLKRTFSVPRHYVQMYEKHFGKIPIDESHKLRYKMLVCHKCDNGSFCVNPLHLFLGTNKDNLADCAKKGRNGAKKAVETRKLRGDVFCTPESIKKTIETKRKNGGKGFGNTETAKKAWITRRKNGKDKVSEETKNKMSDSQKIRWQMK